MEDERSARMAFVWGLLSLALLMLVLNYWIMLHIFDEIDLGRQNLSIMRLV